MQSLKNYIVEAWGSQRHYESDLKKIFDEFDKKKNAGPMKMKRGYVEPPSPYPVLAKYPMQILIDKAGYTPKEVINYKGKKRIFKERLRAVYCIKN